MRTRTEVFMDTSENRPPRIQEAGWFEIASEVGRRIKFIEVLVLFFIALLAAFVTGQSIFIMILAAVSDGPGQQGVVLAFDWLPAPFWGLTLLLAGPLLIGTGLASGFLGYVWLLVGATTWMFLFSLIFLSFMGDFLFVLAWSLHSATLYGPLAASFFWEALLLRHPDLAPGATSRDTRWRLLLLATVIILGHVLSLALALVAETQDAKSSQPSPEQADKYVADNLPSTRRSAESGSTSAQYQLGRWYSLGRGVPKDNTEAAHWYRLAAEQGHVQAQTRLAELYYRGEGVPQNNQEAVRLLRLAAEEDFAPAQIDLAWAYYRGEGVREDLPEAAHWFRAAAKQGYANAQYQLAVMYDLGEGVPEDRVRALAWLLIATEAGHRKAQLMRNQVIQELRYEELTEARELSRVCIESGLAECPL
ncbi:tetratricopeptide repeat protein [Ovoidimarina sediminis]|uniref:tetratricopeptide repeat protein n=1 Tax=Ovoidimarina sediminis TaxID=3079856 RepID=UPI002907C538|nr:tetratricopeptide repeat protein [Rhodophyticola sp. MJ-SS7]MDU8946329.1 tetratricopeptide repeat protein [Rhodophyticola sp. MJ-SS7]